LLQEQVARELSIVSIGVELRSADPAGQAKAI